MPEWDTRERHEVRVSAPPTRVYQSLRLADLAGHPAVRTLLTVRALPLALSRQGRQQLRERSSRPVTLSVFEMHGFRLVAEYPPCELLLGLEGEFWRPAGNLRQMNSDSFEQPVRDGFARALWNFSIVPDTSDTCTLRTETRVRAGDHAARWKFRLYWVIVRPGSGLIRQLMLRAIREEAER